MAKPAQSGIATGAEGLVCFVCDVPVVGRYYALASCRTQTSRVRLIEKLGHLVGDDYMVVISEEDVICRGCATMVNSLDRLEKELGSLRSVVLRYLEKKYDLADGELVNTRANLPPSPPKDSTDILSTDFHTRKRKAISGEIDLDELKDGKDSVWYQCDRCRYTTHFNMYMVHHVRSHSKEKPVGPIVTPTTVANQSTVEQSPAKATSSTPHEIEISLTEPKEEEKSDKEGKEIEEAVEIESEPAKKQDEEESVEMIAAEIEQGFQEETSVDDEQLLSHIVGAEGRQMTLQEVEGENGSNTLCMVDENGMIVQKVEQAEDGTLYVQMADNTDPSKQVISVAEDGSVQMVEVLWDEDIVQGDDNESHMVTF